MNNTVNAGKLVRQAIKTLLNKYDESWYENEANVEQNIMSAEDYAIYSDLFDAREELRRAKNK